MFDKENPNLSAKEALSLLRAPLAPEGQPDSPSTLHAHETAVAKRFATHTPTLPKRTPLTPKSPNPHALGTPKTPAGLARTTEDFDLSFNSTGAGSTPGTALSSKSGAGSVTRRFSAIGSTHSVTRRPSPVLESSPTYVHARLGNENRFDTQSNFEETNSTGGAFSPTVRNAVNKAAIVEAAAACTPGNKITHPTPMNTPMGYVHPVEVFSQEASDATLEASNESASSSPSSNPTDEEVIEEVRSWFASVHSKLDVALHAISPGPVKHSELSNDVDALEESNVDSVESNIDSNDTEQLVMDTMHTPSSGEQNLNVFPKSVYAYPTPVGATAEMLEEESRRAAAALTKNVLERLTLIAVEEETVGAVEEETVTLPVEEEVVTLPVEEPPLPEESVMAEEFFVPEEVAMSSPVARVAVVEEIVTCLTPVTPVVMTTTTSTPEMSHPPLFTPPASSPQVGHTASELTEMTPETIHVVTMVTCAALLSGYTVAMIVFATAMIFNGVSAVCGAVYGLQVTAVPAIPSNPAVIKMHGAYMLYLPQLVDLGFAAERALGSVLARFGGGEVGFEEIFDEETIANTSSSLRVDVTFEGLCLLFLVIVSSILVVWGVAAVMQGTDKVGANTKQVLVKVMAAMEAKSPGGVMTPRRF